MCLAQNSASGIVGFTNNHREQYWTDRDTLRLMGVDGAGADGAGDKIRNTQQAAANYHCWQKRRIDTMSPLGSSADAAVAVGASGTSGGAVLFASQWLALAQDRRLLQDYKDYLQLRKHLKVSSVDGYTGKGAVDEDDPDHKGVCGLGQHEMYSDHREDQSILSILLKQWRVRTFPEPSQWLVPPKCSPNSPSCAAAAEIRKSAGLPNEAFYSHTG
jgi:hypothetical protein